MRRLFIHTAVLAFLLLPACGGKAKKLPIPEPELPAILADLHMAEAIIQNADAAIRDSIADVYYRQIFLIHGVSEADFDSTMSILREDPGRIEPIYTKVMEILSEEEARLDQ